jgi:hypothetical protein
MLKAMGVPTQYWGEAVSTAVFVLNHAYTRSVQDKMPYEAWSGRKPSVDFLRVFGCTAHAKDTHPHLNKLDDRSKAMVFFGYEPGSKAYRLYDPVGRHVHVSRDVVFDEHSPWNWAGVEETSSDMSFVIDPLSVISGGAFPQAVPTPPANTPAPPSPSSPERSNAPTPPMPSSPTTHANIRECWLELLVISISKWLSICRHTGGAWCTGTPAPRADTGLRRNRGPQPPLPRRGAT